VHLALVHRLAAERVDESLAQSRRVDQGRVLQSGEEAAHEVEARGQHVFGQERQHAAEPRRHVILRSLDETAERRAATEDVERVFRHQVGDRPHRVFEQARVDDHGRVGRDVAPELPHLGRRLSRREQGRIDAARRRARDRDRTGSEVGILQEPFEDSHLKSAARPTAREHQAPSPPHGRVFYRVEPGRCKRPAAITPRRGAGGE
jgi:hypothetical protein